MCVAPSKLSPSESRSESPSAPSKLSPSESRSESPNEPSESSTLGQAPGSSLPVANNKIGLEIEFKPREEHDVGLTNWIYSNHRYDSKDMPTLKSDGIARWELDLEKRNIIVLNTVTEGVCSKDTTPQYVKLTQWAFEALMLTERETLQEKLHELAKEAPTLMTGSTESSLCVTQWNDHVVTPGDIKELFTFQAQVKAMGSNQVIANKNYWATASAYVQANVDMTVETYITKIKAVYESGWWRKSMHASELGDHGISADLFFESSYKSYGGLKKAAGKTLNEFEKLVLWFIANAGTVAVGELEGISSRFKNAFFIMPKMNNMELAKQYEYDAKKMKEFLDGIGTRIPEDATVGTGTKPKFMLRGGGGASYSKPTGRWSEVYMSAEKLSEIFATGRRNTGDFIGCKPWSKQMQANIPLFQSLAKKKQLIAEFRWCSELLDISVESECGVVEFKLAKYDKGKLFENGWI